MTKSVLITNMKQHMGFPLVPFNDLERRNDCWRALSAVAELLYNHTATRAQVCSEWKALQANGKKIPTARGALYSNPKKYD